MEKGHGNPVADTQAASATSDYYIHENDKLSVFNMPSAELLVGFLSFIINHSSPKASAYVGDASLVSLDIWLPFYPVPRIVSQMLCDRSTPSYQSSFTLTRPQLHINTSGCMYWENSALNHLIILKPYKTSKGATFVSKENYIYKTSSAILNCWCGWLMRWFIYLPFCFIYLRVNLRCKETGTVGYLI